MKTWCEVVDELAADEGVYSLLLTGAEARATLRALTVAEDCDAAAARDRLARLLGERACARPGVVGRTECGDRA